MGNRTMTDRVVRKLTAILCPDVAGYSRLMGDDEPQTVRTLQSYRQIFIRQIESRRGRRKPAVRAGAYEAGQYQTRWA